MVSRESFAKAVQEVIDHVQLVDHVKALQQLQKETADAVAELGHRLRDLERDIMVLKSEIKLESLREAQNVVYNVQNGLNQRIETLAVKVAVAEALAMERRRAPDPAVAVPSLSKSHDGIGVASGQEGRTG